MLKRASTDVSADLDHRGRGARARAWLRVAALALVCSACPSGPAEPAAAGSEVLRDDKSSAPTSPSGAEEAIDFEAQAEAIAARGNHLVGEASPYLEAHAHNPVDWYPWGEEALRKAVEEDKPIFLSIGYSTCHWCHVMEEESFENVKTAAFLNEHFVSIKVDRERRPDLDALFISAVSAMGANTGWPLTVFLTPQLEPFFGGTYFPPVGKHGRPGFPDVLEEVRATWARDGETAAKRGAATLARVRQRAQAASGGAVAPLAPDLLARTVARLAEARDTDRGGFGSRRKFPNPPLLEAELRAALQGDDAAQTHLSLTLDEMAAGGIRDQVRGSFHRYAVDPRWHVPHFEKMLYDNAQLARLYVVAGLALEREDWVDVGRSVLDDLLAHWRDEQGAFIVGFDADDPGGEGAYYTWTPAELASALGAERGRRVATVFGVDARGERELQGRSVLHRATQTPLDAELVAALAALEPVRARRPAPAKDDKVLVAWNALAIAALADSGRWLETPRYTQAAAKAAEALWSRCWAEGTLTRGLRGSEPLGPGFLADYAGLGLAFVALHAATGDVAWLVRARTLQSAMRDRFYDPKGQVYLRTDAAHDIPVRLPDLDDGVQPSGGAMAVALELQIAALAGDTDTHDRARAVLGRIAPSVERQPMSRGAWLLALDLVQHDAYEVVLAGDPTDAATQALWAEVAPRTSPRLFLARVGAEGVAEPVAEAFAALAGKRALRGKPTAYVCQQGSCKAPTSSPEALRDQLDSLDSLDSLD